MIGASYLDGRRVLLLPRHFARCSPLRGDVMRRVSRCLLLGPRTRPPEDDRCLPDGRPALRCPPEHAMSVIRQNQTELSQFSVRETFLFDVSHLEVTRGRESAMAAARHRAVSHPCSGPCRRITVRLQRHPDRLANTMNGRSTWASRMRHGLLFAWSSVTSVRRQGVPNLTSPEFRTHRRVDRA